MDTSWKIAVIGSGPAGFYATGELFRQKSWDIKVDMFDRLPTPFGLVRGGVAPDHQKIKSVTKIYNRIAENPNFRFFGNVEFGSDLYQPDLLKHYDAVLSDTKKRQLYDQHGHAGVDGRYSTEDIFRGAGFNFDDVGSIFENLFEFY